MSEFSTGLMVSIVGLSITFLALLIFIGVIVLLKKIFPYKEVAEETPEAEAPALASSKEEEIAAVIAAVSYAKAQADKQGSSKNPMWTSR